jgi:peptidyl-prolyl cis-trans isomerase B (cyclophilin B)
VTARRSPFLLLVILAVLLPIAGCGGDDEKSGKAAGNGAGQPECKKVAQPEPGRVKRREGPDLRLSPEKQYTATLETSCGSFTIELDSRQAPRTGGSFVALARDGFYDGLTFHRIVPGFVIQGGDPNGDGSGGPGYTIRERPPRDAVYSEGVVAMAKTAAEPAGTSGSQFFVVTSDNSGLEPEYALLGRVTEGLDVVHTIGRVPTGPGERPLEPVVIERVTIAER